LQGLNGTHSAGRDGTLADTVNLLVIRRRTPTGPELAEVEGIPQTLAASLRRPFLLPGDSTPRKK